MRSALALSSALIATLLAAPASAQQLSGAELESYIAGKRVYLSTPYGLELPLNYRVGGAVDGDVSGFRLASMFAPKETGRWWVDGDQLCQQWPTWYDGETFCFTVNQTGEGTISWVRNDGLTGTARVTG